MLKLLKNKSYAGSTSVELIKIAIDMIKSYEIPRFFFPKYWFDKCTNKHENINVEILSAIKEDDLERVLLAMAELEHIRKTAPKKSGVMLEKLLRSEKGLEKIKSACTNVFEQKKDSVYIIYLYSLSLAKSGDFEQARKIVSDAIIANQAENIKKIYSRTVLKKRTIALVKVWRVLDLIAREDMCWLNGSTGSRNGYISEEWLKSYGFNENDTLDSQLIMYFSEPLLQGKHLEEYLLKCILSFKNSKNLSSKLTAIFAMRRQGIRRLKSYNKAYDLARDFYKTIRDDFNSIIDPIISDKKEIPLAPVATARLLRQFMVVAKELRNKENNEKDQDIYHEDIQKIERALTAIALSWRGREAIWICALTLMEIDASNNLEVSKKIISLAKNEPKKPRQIFDFINWANLAQEYDIVEKVFQGQPTKFRNSKFGLAYVKTLQRSGRFKEAVSLTQDIHSNLLRTTHNICPYSSWGLVKRSGELRFLEDTADIYTKIIQPQNPKGVIFITPRSIEQLRKTPIVVLMELKKMGWAVVPLTRGILPIEKTGNPLIDQFAGCFTLDRTMDFEKSKQFQSIKDFSHDISSGEFKWKTIDLSTALWEEASINRRTYNVDYSCPALHTYLGNVIKSTELSAIALENIMNTFKNSDLRVGFIIQFNSRLPDALYRFYCEQFGDPNKFFCLHSANGYQNYFANFSTPVSTKGVMRNMTRHKETRSAGFPIPSEFEKFYESNKDRSEEIFNMVKDVTKVKRSTSGQKELPKEAEIALNKINNWKEGGGKVACAFGKVVCDPGVPVDGGKAHRNLKEWLNHTIDSVRDSNTLLLIKPHPHEVNESVACFLNEYFFDLIEVALPNNVILVGHKWFDIHQLKNIVDLGLIYNGTTAVELGILDIPSVLCSHFAPIDYPVGHVTPQNKEDYRKLVRFEKKAVVNKDLRYRSALWIYYMSEEGISLNYRYHSRPITNKVVYPPYWFEDDIKKYLHNGDDSVTQLALRAID